MASESRLLVLGPDLDSNVAVAYKLQALSNADSYESDMKLLNIQTKYYRASVELHVHQVRDNTPEPALQHEPHDYEAIMCVVDDASYEDSFLHVHAFAKHIVDIFPYDVCLLVAYTSSTTMENVEKMKKWCQDNSFEFIELDATNDVNDASFIDEKMGIERVLEALQCNMWKSMEMNSPKAETLSPSKVEKTLEVTCEKNSERIEAIGEIDATDDTKPQSLVEALDVAGKGTDSGHGDDGADAAQFSDLIAEVRNVRDQGQFLTDEKRRERAAEVAMKLWNFLGADDENGD